MKTRDLWIAIVVLAALSGVLYWSNHHKPKEDDTIKASVDSSPKILSLSQPDIAGLQIERKDQPALALLRNSAGNWKITAPTPLPADQDSVSNMLFTLSALNSDRLVDEKASNLASYGLASPALQVAVTLKDNKTQKLLIGDQTPAGNAYYAMLAGDPRLFTLAAYNKNNLDKSANDLRDKRLFSADFDKVSQIELLNQSPDKKSDLTLAREKDAWQILKPKPYRADSGQVDDLIRALREAKFETTGADESNAKLVTAFKSAKPLATAKITGASGTQELEIRKDKDGDLAKSSALEGVYKVPATLATSLSKTLDDFRNKKLFDFGYQDPNKIEVHDGAKSYFLTRSGTDWWGPDGKKLDTSTAEAVIGSLRDLSATKFPDSGFGNPEIQITVTSQDGKRLERVSAAKAGDSYVAKREDEATLYEIPATSFTELQKAAAGLKSAPAPQK
jgi:Domain of unknown function (DUF4340)